MKDIDKAQLAERVIGQIPDSATIMIGGFGTPGTPFYLIQELVRQGQQNLTVIKNDANEPGMGLDHLLAGGQVSKLIASHIGLNPNAIEQMNQGALQVELCSQGILVERIRAAGAGLFGFLTDIGIGTSFAENKTMIDFEGRSCIVEPALHADFALVHAAKADPFGNLLYQASARNFNPIMAQAGDKVIAEVESIVEYGELSADAIHTPGVFIDQVVAIPELSKEYDVVTR